MLYVSKIIKRNYWTAMRCSVILYYDSVKMLRFTSETIFQDIYSTDHENMGKIFITNE